MTSASQPTFFAVLIGIDNYPQRPLISCVRDVRGIRKCLVDRADAANVKLCVTTLTSCGSNPGGSTELGADSTGFDVEEPATYDGIIKSLERTAQSARQGDFVYIHFSGHGTHLPPGRSVKSTRHNIGDTALVVFHDDLAQEIRYLRGWYLAKLVHKMVENTDHHQRPKVVLALDCCFSGSVMRHGDDQEVANARYLPYDKQVDEAFPPISTELPDEEDFPATSATDTRAGSLLPDWIKNPRGYCILAACGPHELALNIGGRSLPAYGVFSHCLIQSLCIHDFDSFRQVFQHVLRLCTQLQAKFRPIMKQNPMWFGNIELQLLGADMTKKDAVTYLVAAQNAQNNTSLRLEGGWIHGIREGDVFNLISRAAVEPVAIAKAVYVGGVVSTLQTENGSAVKVASNEVLLATPIIQNIFHDYGTIVSISALSIQAVREWELLQQRDPWLHLDDGEPGQVSVSPVFRIEPSNSGIGYDIRNVTSQIIGAALDASSAIGLAQQAAMWMFVRDIHSESDSPETLPESSYRTRFSHLNNPGGAFLSGSILSVRHGDMIEIFIENLDTQILYVHIYRLGQDWEIDNMIHARYLPLYPARSPKQEGRVFDTPYERRSRKPFRIKMTVPEGQQCQDIFKIFITERPVSLDVLTRIKFGGRKTGNSNMHRADEGRLEGLTAFDAKDKWVVFDVTVKVSREEISS